MEVVQYSKTTDVLTLTSGIPRLAFIVVIVSTIPALLRMRRLPVVVAATVELNCGISRLRNQLLPAFKVL